MSLALTDRLCQIGEYWISKHPQRPAGDWCRTWYDPAGRQTRRVSLGTTDLPAAASELRKWYGGHLLGLSKARSKHDRPVITSTSPKPPTSVLIEAILLAYWEGHAKSRPSSKTEFLALGYWTEFWGGKTVDEITPDQQERFRKWLEDRPRQRPGVKPIGNSGIDRILSAGRAALRRAVKYQQLTQAPHIFSLMTAEAKRGRAPKGRPLLIEELAALFNAAASSHVLQYLLIACATLARPAAIIELQSAGYDAHHQLINLNPPSREQNKKFRPLLPVAPTLRPWLDLNLKTGKSGRYITFKGEPIRNIMHAWRILKGAAKLDEKVTPYSIRHTMAREMRKRRVPTEEIGLFLGHLPNGAIATTSTYAPYEPEFLSHAIEVIEEVFGDLRKLVRPGLLSPSADAPAQLRPRSVGQGIGEERREQVRKLILAGIAHRQIVKTTGVSSGTVSGIRHEIKAQRPLMRATGCVTLALLSAKVPATEVQKPEAKLGGPGRTRTCDNTVMSGAF
jgi:integrase